MRVAERKGKIRRQERGKRVKARYKVCERKQGDLEGESESACGCSCAGRSAYACWMCAKKIV